MQSGPKYVIPPVGLDKGEFSTGYTTHSLPFKKFPFIFPLIFLTKYISLYASNRPRSNLDTIWPLNSLFNLCLLVTHSVPVFVSFTHKWQNFRSQWMSLYVTRAEFHFSTGATLEPEFVTFQSLIHLNE